MEYISASRLSEAIRSRSVSCLEVMQHYLAKIKKYNPSHNAIVDPVSEADLLDQANAADVALAAGQYSGWMHGMPHAVKDLADIKGRRTSFGSPMFIDSIAGRDEIFVARLRAAGAIFIGKTNVPEFGLGSQSYNNVYGATKNAFDINLTAGGSSGGAACALALGLIPVADGSDMMGSLRNPAAYNNVAGFRPSIGIIPAFNEELYFSQLASNGPMARTIEDLEALFNIMSGPDDRNPLSLMNTPQGPSRTGNHGKTELKVAWLADLDGYLPMEAGIIEQCESALRPLEDTAIRVQDLKLKFPMDELWHAWMTLRHWFVASGKAELLKRPGAERLMKPELIWEIEQGLKLSGEQIFSAAKTRSAWHLALTEVFDDYDVIAMPSAQVYAFDVNQHWPKQIAGTSMATYHQWMEVTIGASMAGCPVVSLPAGFKGGKAMGIQFMTKIGSDIELLSFAKKYETLNPWQHLYH